MKYWNGLNAREQFVTGLGLPLVILVAIYLYYWQPAHQRLERLRIEIPQQTAELAWIRHEIGKAEQWLGARTENGEGSAILTIIERRAISSGVKASIQRVQPTSSREVQMWFREAAADSWLIFVNLLAGDGLGVESATITRSKQGRINARVTFSR